MKFSIIIATLNNEDTLDRNLQSIKKQSYQNYEIIVIDGYSKDKTLEIIKNYNFKNIKIKTQKGFGVYNAFNEGINDASGELILILNADDFFEREDALYLIFEEFNGDKDLKLLMSNVNIINKKNKIVRVYDAGLFKNFMFYFGLMPPHPGIVVKKKVYDQFGYFNESFKNAGDFEFLLRVLLKGKIKYKKINQYLVTMSHGGKSNKNLNSFFINTKEIKKALKVNNYFSSYFFIMMRFIIKLFQFKVQK